MRIMIVGAQGVGKTTLAKKLTTLNFFKDFEMVPSARQKLIDAGIDHWTPDEVGEKTQSIYMDHYMDFIEQRDIIFDRCPIDVLTFTGLAVDDNKMNVTFFARQLVATKKFLTTCHKEDLIFFIRPEFDPFDDDYRSVTREYQDVWTAQAEEIMTMLDVKPIILSGSIEERALQVLDIAVHEVLTRNSVRFSISKGWCLEMAERERLLGDFY